MNNILLKIEYDGTRYKGWQSQRTATADGEVFTVQETISAALSRMLQHPVNLIGSGRTDAGVHAKAQYANFKTPVQLPLSKLKRSLNGMLPGDIRIKSARYVGGDFHAQYRAKGKVYRYTILNHPDSSAFLRQYAYTVRVPLDISAMRREAAGLIGEHDFSSFQASDSKSRHPVRTVRRLVLRKRGRVITIDIEADGFLYNMVRNIVGTLVEIGRNKLGRGSMRAILQARNRQCAGPTAPPQGLCLMKVYY
ncbi:MAG: tRNA pseudouridine(38-40) synthase TruA [Candidatus Omnitrophica bacterium]|nr:tRNA pseudouridine(38-40) synthase TruA [Candidatus Omnitrophota bacterium]